MSTLDDSPEFGSANLAGPSLVPEPEPEPEYGTTVQALLAAAAKSNLVRTQRLGVKAQAALDALAKAIKTEARLNELSAEIARLRKGGE